MLTTDFPTDDEASLRFEDKLVLESARIRLVLSFLGKMKGRSCLHARRLALATRATAPRFSQHTDLRFPSITGHLNHLARVQIRKFTQGGDAQCIPLPLSPRTGEELKQRIGHCIKFGLTRAQLVEAAEILRILASDWRELLAGCEGFLTSKERRGLYRQEVVWGEMDVMVCSKDIHYLHNALHEGGNAES